MARTPLLGKLQALYRDFAEADHTGKPVEQNRSKSGKANGVT